MLKANDLNNTKSTTFNLKTAQVWSMRNTKTMQLLGSTQKPFYQEYVKSPIVPFTYPQ